MSELKRYNETTIKNHICRWSKLDNSTIQFHIYEHFETLESKMKELKKECSYIKDRYFEEVKQGSDARTELVELKHSIVPTETIINGFANLFVNYKKDKDVVEQSYQNGIQAALADVGKIYYRYSTGEITLREFADELTKLREK